MIFKKYIILILLIFLFTQSIPLAVAEDEVTWDDEVTFTFSWSSFKFPKGDYVIKLSDFSGEGLVALDILKDDVVVENVILSEGTIWNYNDEIKLQAIKVTNKNVLPSFGFWPSNPKAEVKMWRGKFAVKDAAILSIGISTESPYELDSDIKLNVTLENDGDLTARDVTFDIDIDDLTLKNNDYKLSYNYLGGIEGDAERTEELKLRFPTYPKKNSYPLTVNASWSDSNGTVNTVQRSVTIKIKDPIQIRKNIIDEISIGKNVYVSIRVSNVQSRKVHVVLNDSIPVNFKLIDGNENMSWEFDLPAKEYRVFEYTLLPEIPGKLKMPAASATWNMWGDDINTNSNAPSIDVHGPYIYVTKTLNSEKTSTTLNVQKNDLINVNVKMENIGDLPINVTITDVLPKSALLIEDEDVLTHSGFVRPGESLQFNYTMRIVLETISDVQVPEPIIQLSMPLLLEDLSGYENAYTIADMPSLRAKYVTGSADGFVPSSTIDKKVTVPVEDENVQNVTQSKQLDHIKDVIMPGFEGIFAIIAIIMVFFLRKKHEE
ncbi:MAG: PGF-CTERM sorting domain-containing protein [Methanosarcinaceae archaeon]|nr:PGF-CTERM sorting domain-containing protein [Methanosarcinaceae archaeon]